MTDLRNLSFCMFFVICTSQVFAQHEISHKVKALHHTEMGRIKQPIYEFLITWNTSAVSMKPASKALQDKIKENKQKGKDPEKGTEKLQEAYDNLVVQDGKERSFLAETFALPMHKEMKTKGTSLDAADLYAAQYVIKFVLGMPRFNHGHLDIDNFDEMEKELTNLIQSYPVNDAHNQEVDGHVIDIFCEEAEAFFQSFVAANKKQYMKDQGNNKGDNNYVTGLTNMNCGEKYELLKEKGIMH
ncbi:MAG: hypothetical protein ACJA08_001911 [Cyclobacteriaceae bacterium]|jgi:hypothetical protein